MDNTSKEPNRRLPSRRLTAALAAAMLGLGVGVGAAIGPAPETSQAGDAAALAARLPLLIRALSARAPGSGSTSASEPEEAASEELLPRRHRHHRRHAAAATGAGAEAPSAGAEAGPEGAAGRGSTPAGAPRSTGASKLPAVTNVWLIELDGGSFAQAVAQPAATPFIHASVLPGATLLSGFSAVEGQVLAADAAAAAKPAVGGTPPLLHTIVQPPCPEGSTACAPETPGQLTAADQFLQATLEQITGTAAYREHGLVVITFASVAIPTQSGLPAGSSSATLTTQPPAGVVLMSPFARAGSRPSAKFNPASPVRALEGLLHR